MNRITLIIISIFLVSCGNNEKKNQLEKENEELKKKLTEKETIVIEMQNINDFIPSGYEVVKSGNELNKVSADLNRDGIKDYVLLLAQNSVNGDYSKSKSVRLSIFEGNKNGTYKLKSQTGNLTSSFLHSNPNKRINVSSRNVISLKHQSMRHDYELKFRFESKYQDYMLIGSEYNNYGSASIEDDSNTSTNFLTGKRIIKTNRKSETKNIGKELKPISAVDEFNIYELTN